MGRIIIYEVLMYLLVLLFKCAAAQGSSVLICSTSNITGWPGHDVILPCRLQPPLSVESMRVEWTRPDLEPKFIHVHQDGRFLDDLQNPKYNSRTSLFVDQLLNGNVSLKLSNVTLSDAGRYRCSLPSVHQEAFVQLSVGSEVIGSHEPVRAVVGADVILPCHLEPPFDITTLTVEWTTSNGEVVHKYKSQRDNPDLQDDRFKGRTSLFHDEMHTGNISLKLTNVNLTDAGNYTCSVGKQLQRKKDNVELIVDSKEKGRNVGPSEASPTVSTGTTVPTNTPVPTLVLIIIIILAVAILIACLAVAGLVLWILQENRRQRRNQPGRNPERPENIPMM